MTTIINGSSPSITFSDSTTQTTAFTTTPVINSINSVASTPLTFGINGTESGRFDSSGNLLVGTTAQLGSEKAAFVSGSSAAVITLRYSGATAGRYTRLACDGNNAIFIIDNNGTGQYQNYGSSSWTATSDERYKDIIEPIENATEKVASLRSVIGKLKTDPEGTRKSFLIAQDVQAVFPEAVDANDPDKLGVAYTDIIPLLVASIKELNAKVESLQKPTPTADQIAAKASALAKLTALGLTQDEVKALVG